MSPTRSDAMWVRLYPHEKASLEKIRKLRSAELQETVSMSDVIRYLLAIGIKEYKACQHQTGQGEEETLPVSKGISTSGASQP